MVSSRACDGLWAKRSLGALRELEAGARSYKARKERQPRPPHSGQVSPKAISRLDWTLTKPTLAEWLAELHEDEIEADEGDPEPDYFDDDEVEAQERNQRRVVWNFPSDQALDEFVSTISVRSQSEVDPVLRHLLIPSCALGADHMKLDIYLTFRQQGDPESIQMAAEMMRSTHFQRIYAYYGGKTSELPWEGIR